MAFQVSAFQDNAYQTSGTLPPVVTTPTPPGKQGGWHGRKDNDELGSYRDVVIDKLIAERKAREQQPVSGAEGTSSAPVSQPLPQAAPLIVAAPVAMPQRDASAAADLAKLALQMDTLAAVKKKRIEDDMLAVLLLCDF